MNKRKLFKTLSTIYEVKKSSKKYYDFDVKISNINYQLKVIPCTSNSQVTVNSKKVIEVAKGKLDGIRFKKTQQNLYRLDKYYQEENKLIYLTDKPFRILQYLNEADIIDVSNSMKVNGFIIFTDIDQLNEL